MKTKSNFENRFAKTKRMITKSPLKTTCVCLALCVFLIACAFVYVSRGMFSVVSFLALCVLAFLAVCTLRTPYGRENFFDRHKKGSILTVTVAVVVLVISCCLKFELCKEEPMIFAPIFERINAHFGNADLFGYYTALLSLTFITISVMSVLSDKSVIIYWANVSEDMLIRPTFSCFAAYTYYSIGTTLGAGLGVVLQSACMFAVFFALNIGVLILLTVSMIDVYYGRDTKKKKLVQSLVPNRDGKGGYENKILGLEQNLLAAHDQKDMAFLREVYELCCVHPKRFCFEIGHEAIAVMVSTLDAQTTGPFLRELDKNIVSRLEHFRDTGDIATEEQLLSLANPLYDDYIWEALTSKRALPFLEEVAVTAEGDSSPNGVLFTRILMRRLALYYNFGAALFLAEQMKNGKTVTPAEYFVYDDPINSIYEPKTADGTPLAYERLKEVLEYAKWCREMNRDIVWLMGRLVEHGSNWFSAEQFSALPYVTYWTEGGLEGGIGFYRPGCEAAAKRVAEMIEAEKSAEQYPD